LNPRADVHVSGFIEYTQIQRRELHRAYSESSGARAVLSQKKALVIKPVEVKKAWVGVFRIAAAKLSRFRIFGLR